MGYPLPDPRMENPAMFLPRKKPIGRVAIDSSRELSRGLVFCSLDQLDLTGKNNHLTPIGIGRVAGGFNFDSPSLTSHLSCTETSGVAGGAGSSFTIYAQFVARSYVSLANIFGYGKALPESVGQGQGRYLIQFNGNYYFWGIGADWDSGVAFDADGEKHTVCVVVNGASIKLFKDGDLVASGTTTSSLTTISAPKIYVGSGHTGAASGPDMIWLTGGIYDAPLSDADAMRLTVNPYQFLIPA